MKSCSCARCKPVVESQLTPLHTGTSSSEESNERVTEGGQRTIRDLYAPAPRASSSPQNSLTDEEDKQDDTGISGDFHGYDPDASNELEQLKTSDHPPELDVNNSDLKPAGSDYWCHVDSSDGDSVLSDEKCNCEQCNNSTPSECQSSSTSSYKGTEEEKDEMCEEINSTCPLDECGESDQAYEDVDASFNLLLQHSSDALRILDYELYKCVMGMQQALETAYRALRKLRNAQRMVNHFGRDLNTSLDQVSTSILSASAVKAKQIEADEKAMPHHNGM
ncbi:hypothetical protein TSMEX_010094 [Taenia solium]|eukprot:TsM_000534800 transcript=TsM_000534800 gene=TsM_000534800